MENEDRRPFVLFSDDNPDILRILTTYATIRGYRFETARTAEEMLEKISSHCNRTGTCFDIIVGDLSYQNENGKIGLDGLSALREIRKTFPNLPFMFLSALLEALTETEAKRLGAFVMPKPVELDALFDRLENILRMTRSTYDGPERRRRSINPTDHNRRRDDPKDTEEVSLSTPPVLAEVHERIAAGRAGK